MCVFEIHVLKILNWETILRDYCVDWIIGWVACWIAFMSVFFSSRKTILKSWLDTSLTPSRYLAICWASQAFFLTQSRHLLDTWWIDRASVLGSDSLLLDTSAIDKHFLDTYLDSFLNTSRHLICRALLKVLFKPPRAIRSSLHSIFLLIDLCFLSQTLSSHSNLNPQRFLEAFSRFSSLGKLLIFHSSCISCFET